jgi:hypothetical protein
MSRIRISELLGGSVLELTRQVGGRTEKISFGNGTPLIEAAIMQDVYYAPSALAEGQSIQIVGQRHLPVEAVFDDFTVGFVRQNLLKRGLTELPECEDTMDGPVCILGNVFSRNFGHWHEELMKVIVLEKTSYECHYVIAKLPAFAKEMLGLIGIAPERILEIQRPVHFRAALFTTPVSYRNVAEYPGVLFGLRERLLAADCSREAEIGPRLWLERGKQTRLGRKLVNEEEVWQLLDRYSFKRFDMGALPVLSQIACARNARVISGLHGAQFIHTQLMNPNSWVIECFSPMYLNPVYTDIYRVLQHSYAQVTSRNIPLSPYPHGSDVLVDCQQLDLALRAAARTSERAR